MGSSESNKLQRKDESSLQHEGGQEEGFQGVETGHIGDKKENKKRLSEVD